MRAPLALKNGRANGRSLVRSVGRPVCVGFWLHLRANCAPRRAAPLAPVALALVPAPTQRNGRSQRNAQSREKVRRALVGVRNLH